MHGRWSAGPIAATLALLTLAGSAQAADPTITIGPDGKTAPAFSYTDAIRQRVFIPVPGVDQDRDGVDDRTAIEIMRPEESNEGLKVPAIIDPSPYYTTLGRGNESQLSRTSTATASTTSGRCTTTTTSSRAATR